MNSKFILKNLLLDITNSCNLSCPLCPNTHRRNKDIILANQMSFQNFKKLVDNIDFNLEEISIGTKSEPLLNKDIFSMANYLHSKQTKTDITLLSNFNFDIKEEEIINSNINNILIGLDGIDQNSYCKYRVGGNFDKVINNIEKIQKFKKKYSLKNPNIIISFIVFSHNEHLIQQAKNLFNSLEIDFFFRRTDYHDGYEQWFPKHFVSEQKTKNTTLKINNICEDPFKLLVIDTFGNITPCCAEESLNYIVGNIFEEKLSKIWEGQRLNEIRNFLTSNKENIDIPCKSCPIYKNNEYTESIRD